MYLTICYKLVDSFRYIYNICIDIMISETVKFFLRDARKNDAKQTGKIFN